MKNVQVITDKLAISLSFLCAVHCLAFPLIVATLPALSSLQFDGEAFHFWMVLIVIPTSVYALTLGCRKHKHYRLIVVGGCGLVLMVAAILFGKNLLGELGEKGLTLIGAGLLALGHYRNFRLCQRSTERCCPGHQGEHSH